MNIEKSCRVETLPLENTAINNGRDSQRHWKQWNKRLGEFAALDEDTIVPSDELFEATNREFIFPAERVLHIGVDVSSGSGTDSSVISMRVGNMELQRYKEKCELRELYEKIVDIVDDNLDIYSNVVLNLDTTGLGIQIGQDLHNHYKGDDRVKVHQINFAMKATDYEMYSNIFTEMMFNLRDRIKEIKLLNIKDSTLIQELGGRRYSFDSSNRFIAERKKDFIKRSGSSPDEGDAVALAFFDYTGHELNFATLRR